ncbi:MAG TPA: bacillithiol biosynthesis cysteine-adding enzyme BshC [Terriglobia bacterium]|nr:bacillithiol biosynthesis cysteine-adding enzyme BshC [Terriglobia bacterium]
MNCSCVPQSQAPKSTALYRDYVYGPDHLSRFYQHSPFDSSSFHSAAEAIRGFHKNRTRLAEILLRQNRAFGCGEATLANIARLAEPGTFAVVTGQQVGLFSGPVFTFYKALTAVRLASAISDSGLPAVPVFWLATEDHDLEEVAQAQVLNEEYETISLRDQGVRPAERSSVGTVKLSDGMALTLGEIENCLPPGDARDQMMEALRDSYRPGATWGAAFGRLMARLFSAWGVILLDPLDDGIHQLAAPIYERAILQAARVRDLLRERSETLIRSGYHAQVHVGVDSTLVFATHEGSRVSIHQRGGEYQVEGAGQISAADLKSWVNRRPIDFSPSALLRPLVQDFLLPTVSYVAGPAEIAYLAQSQVVYEEFGRPFPVIFPRASFTLVDHRTQRLLEKYKLEVPEVWHGEEHLQRKIAAAGFGDGGAEGWSGRMEQSEKEIERLLDRIRADIERIDPTLLDLLKHTEEKMEYQIERLRGKLSRAAFERSAVLKRHEQEVMKFLMPTGHLQERVVSGVYFLGRAGNGLLDRLLDQIQTRSSNHQILNF